MTDLITSPSPPTDSPNVTTQLSTSGGVSLGSGQLLYSTTLPLLFEGSDMDPNAIHFNLTNGGTIWDDDSSGAQVMDLMNWGTIDNSGTIVAHSSAGVAQTMWVTSSFTGGLNNSGSIYALSDTAGAWAFADWSQEATIDNSGTIAALGGATSGAFGLFLANGGTVVNEAGGQILAEAANAVAVSFGRGHFQVDGQAPTATDLTNWGLIEAQSTDPSQASVAVELASLAGESMVIDNHGEITGDFAIYSNSYAFSPPQFSQELVTNESGGVINGEIFLDLGDDQLVNDGQINGYIDMGEGNDLVDTQSGTHNGATDMGWGNDTYLGGSGTDAVMGNRGDDVLSGGGGNDLLLGGWGNDTLSGDGGNDGLYGEGGNDTITTSGGDYVDAGDDNDRVVLGDYSFASVNGGSGYDVLVLPSDPRILSLSQVVASGRVSGFEEVDLAAGDQIVVHPSDVTGMGVTTLTIGGQGSGTVDLAGTWAEGAQQTVGGVTYDSYSSGVSQVLIEHGLTVNLGADPTGATGLDAVASGSAAPTPGSSLGAFLTSDYVTANDFELTSDLEIGAAEHWSSNGGLPIVTSFAGQVTSLVNRGTMESDGSANGAAVVAGYNFNNLFNYGTMTGTAAAGTANLANNENMFETYGIYNTVNNLTGNAYGVDLGGGAWNFLNAGTIQAQSDEAMAVGYLTYGTRPGENDGTIEATSSDFIAVGAYTHNAGEFVNTGTITATGAWGAYGVGSTEFGLSLNNSGTITAYASDPGQHSIGVDLYYAEGTNTITNSGTITAEIAIQSTYTVNGNNVWLDNTGHINGIVRFGVAPLGTPAREDVILNDGTINGDIFLGGGRDVYDGSHGTQAGTVYGEDGNDLLIGTSGHDTMDGGSGDDVLVGQGGDTLTGGGGHDTFVYTGVTPGQVETITDFQSGTDQIDLRPLAPSSVSVDGSTVTAVTASGTLTIHAGVSVALSDVITGATTNVTGTSGNDTLVAGPGGATLSGGDGFDLLVGGSGNDTLDGGATLITDGTAKGDVMVGGAGNDTYVVDSNDDMVIENVNGGTDTIEQVPGQYSLTLDLPENVENFVGTNGVGNELANQMTGTAANDTLSGGDGNDTLNGLAGADILTGGSGIDVLTGGAGGDTFSDTEAGLNGDTITDFSVGDKILFTDATLSDFSFSLSGTTLTYTGGSLTLSAGVTRKIMEVGTTNGVELMLQHLPAHDDFTGDGFSDVLLRNSSGNLTDWFGSSSGALVQLGNDPYAGASVGPVAWTGYSSPSWHVAATGDFNGDGRIDFVLRNDNGSLADWLSQSSNTFSAHNLSSNPGLNWHVVGSGDFNGDGRADLLWQNDDGTLTDWLGQVDGGFVGKHLNANPGSSWHVVGTGDFNGDGLDDILWQNDSGALTDWLGQTDGGFVGNHLTANPGTSWHVVAAGDFNGDGRTDILWRNADGTVTDWMGQRDGSFAGNHLNASLGTDWHAVSVGDLNGDGIDDVLWQSSAGALMEGDGQPNGSFASTQLTSTLGTWQVQDPFVHDPFA